LKWRARRWETSARRKTAVARRRAPVLSPRPNRRFRFAKKSPATVKQTARTNWTTSVTFARIAVGRVVSCAASLAGDRQTEVGDPDPAATVEHDVRGLQVPVEDSLLVSGGNAGAELPGDLEGLVAVEVADPLQQRGQVLAVHELHAQEVLAVHLVHVVDAADVRVGDLPGEPDLRVETGEEPRVGGDRLREELERHGLPESQVVGTVDLPHSAPSEEADDPVPAADHRSRREGAEIERVGKVEPPDRRRRLGRVRYRRGTGLGWKARLRPQLLPAGRAEAARVRDLRSAAGTPCHDAERLPQVGRSG
jgi:hypothetical protein